MRKKQEIKKGIAILRMKGDKISLLQAEVLENGHNESQVRSEEHTSELQSQR